MATTIRGRRRPLRPSSSRLWAPRRRKTSSRSWSAPTSWADGVGALPHLPHHRDGQVRQASEDLELGPALEVDEQELDPLRAVGGEQPDQELAEEGRLAGPGLATDQVAPVRSIFDQASAERCGSRTNALWSSPRSAPERRSGSSTREKATWSAASPTVGRSSAGSAAGRGSRGEDGGSSLHGGGIVPSRPGRDPRPGGGMGLPHQLVVIG